MSLHLRFWGTRGSIPSPGPQTVRFGGNTPCVELRTADGWLIVLDAGTGLRELGQSLIARAAGAPVAGDLFLTHAHWDHIQGIPFFAPVFQRGNHFTIWGARTLETSIDRVVRDQMSPVVFPVAFDALDAGIEFRELPPDSLRRHGCDVATYPVRHPGGALGFRFREAQPGARALVYIADNELGAGGTYDAPDGWRSGLVDFVRGAHVLIHDATYTTDEYAQYRGWGHSTFDDAVALALEAGIDRLLLFHHKPERSDDELDARVAECRSLARKRGGTLDVVAAAEGMELTI
ncbi:MAG TPA: MBL fold metallo-hydrolase [Gemmatimonadaceae bacterium]